MKKVSTWILGIVLALVVVAGLAGLAFALHNRVSAKIVQRVVPHSRIWNGPAAPDGLPERIRPPRVGPGMGLHKFRHRDGPFALGAMFFMLGRLVPLAVLGLLLYGAYQLGKRNVPAPVVVAAVPAPPASATHACPKCENPVQDDWKHCPNCGETQ